MPCYACAHVHIGESRCFHSDGKESLCNCTTNQEGPAMAKNATSTPAEDLGFRVSRVTVKETDDGGKSGDATVIGVGFTQAAGLIDVIGEGVELRAADNRQRAILRSITFKAGKDGKPGTTTLKVMGGADLDGQIGRTVKVTALQMEMPGTR